MDVKPSRLHDKLTQAVVFNLGLDGVVEFHGVDVKDGHTVLLVKVSHDVPGLLRAVAEHEVARVMGA